MMCDFNGEENNEKHNEMSEKMKKTPVLSFQFEFALIYKKIQLVPMTSLLGSPFTSKLALSFPLSSVGSFSLSSLVFLYLHLFYCARIF